MKSLCLVSWLLLLSFTCFVDKAVAIPQWFIGNGGEFGDADDLKNAFLDQLNNFCQGNSICTTDHPGDIAFKEDMNDRNVGGWVFMSDYDPQSPNTGFTLGSPETVTVSAPRHTGNWLDVPTLSGPDADDLNAILHDIRWATGAEADAGLFTITLDNLSIGRTYNLQLVTHENTGPDFVRAWDILFDGALAVDEFDSGGATNPAESTGMFWQYSFEATKTTYVVEFRGDFGGDNIGGERSPILQAVTLTSFQIPEPSSVALLLVSMSMASCLRRRN